jgi:hypothetical protein
MKDRYIDLIYAYARFYTRNDRNTSVLDTITQLGQVLSLLISVVKLLIV